eukprot:scaffold29043_cov112-Isochrysis_galbana.AAC.6
MSAAPSSEFLSRGVEHGRFIGGDAPPAGLAGTAAAAGAGGRRRAVDAGRANAYAVQVPLYDDYN